MGREVPLKIEKGECVSPFNSSEGSELDLEFETAPCPSQVSREIVQRLFPPFGAARCVLDWLLNMDEMGDREEVEGDDNEDKGKDDANEDNLFQDLLDDDGNEAKFVTCEEHAAETRNTTQLFSTMMAPSPSPNPNLREGEGAKHVEVVGTKVHDLHEDEGAKPVDLAGEDVHGGGATTARR